MKANNTAPTSESNRTVLMVDGHGNIRTIRKFHQKLWIGALGVLCSVLLSVGAVGLYVDGLQTQQELQHRIDTLRTQLAEVEHQKDLLLARAVNRPGRPLHGRYRPPRRPPLKKTHAFRRRRPNPLPSCRAKRKKNPRQ